MADLYYIDDDYFTPDGYFVYTADAQANINSSSTLSASVGKLVNASASINSSSTLDANGGKSVVAGASLATAVSLACVADLIKSTTASLTSSSSLTVSAERFRDSSSSQSSTTSLTNLISKFTGLASSLTVSSTMACTAGRIQQGSATFTSAFSPTLTAIGYRNHVANLTSEFVVSVTTRATKRISIALTTSVNLSLQAQKTTNLTRTLTSTATLSAAIDNRTRSGQASIQAQSASSSQVRATKTLAATLASSVTQSATALRIQTSAVALSTTVTLSSLISVTRPAAASLTSEVTQSATALRIKSYEPTPQGNLPGTGLIARYGSGGGFQTGQYLESSWENASNNAASMGVGSVWSIWYRRQDMGERGFMLAQENSNNNNFWGIGWRNYNQMWFGWDGPTQGGPQLDSPLVWSSGDIAQVPQDQDWHHYLIKYDRFTQGSEPGFPGPQTAIFKFWRDGIYLGEDGKANSNTDWWFQEQYLAPIVAGYYDGTFTGIPIVTPGIVGQTWIGEVYEPDFDLSRFYSNGYIDLRSSGVIGPYNFQPYVYTEWDPANTTHLINLPVNSSGPNVFETADWYATPGMRARAKLVCVGQQIQVTQATLTSSSTLTMSVTVVKVATANLTSTATIAATALRTKQLESNFTAIATELVAVIRVRPSGSIDLNSTTSLTASGEVVKVLIATTLASQSSLLAQGEISVKADANLTSNFSLTANVRRTRSSAISVTSNFAQQTTATRTARLVSAMTTASTMTTSALKIPLFGVTMTANISVSADVIATKGFANLIIFANSQLNFSLPRVTRTYQANFNAFYTQLTVGDVIHIDPLLTLLVEPETANFKIIPELRTVVWDSETKELKVIPESRDLIIDSETRLNKIL